MVSAGRPHIGWGEISRIDLTARGPGARRTSALAELDPELRLRRSVTTGSFADAVPQVVAIAEAHGVEVRPRGEAFA